jgi:hypothetical protein
VARLIDFLLTGRLGDIAVGATQDFIHTVLGSPERSEQRNPEIWKYGALQLAFHKSPGERRRYLSFIGLYFQGPDTDVPAALALSGWMPTGVTTFADFRSHLDAAAVLVATASDESIVMRSGVKAYFDAGLLHSLQFLDTRETPYTEPVSVAVPLADLQGIRDHTH